MILIATLLFLIPLFANPSLFLSRDNDLQEFFWPYIHFTKEQILDGIFPLWYPHVLSGTPLLPDPQSPLFYLPNIVFLLLPVNFGFILLFTIHIFVAGIGMFYLCKRILKLPQVSALFTAIVYLANPKVASFIEAGHVGLIFSWAWIPLVFIATTKIFNSNSKKWAIALAFCMAQLFLLHTITFVIIGVAVCVIFLMSLYQKRSRKVLLTFFFAGIIGAGIIAIALLPQIEWSPATNRSILITNPDVYPKWNSKREFFLASVAPWRLPIDSLDTEKFYSFGIGVLILSGLGFLSIPRKYKFVIVTVFIILTLVALNNASPIQNFLLTQPWYKLMRVSTRVYIVPIIILCILAGIGISRLQKRWRALLFVVAVGEIFLLSWMYLAKPRNIATYISNTYLEQIKRENSEPFRIFCLTRCISQQQAALYNLELIDGYGTFAQLNYYKEAWQFTGKYWNYYTLSIPPMGVYTFEKQKPDANSLGLYNTKYIISPYEVQNMDLVYNSKVDGYFVYINKKFKSRAYYIDKSQIPIENAIVTSFSVNKTTIDISNRPTNHLVLAEVYSPGLRAYQDESEVDVLESANGLRSIKLNEGGHELTVEYKPKSYEIGKTITITALIISAVLVLFKK